MLYIFHFPRYFGKIEFLHNPVMEIEPFRGFVKGMRMKLFNFCKRCVELHFV